MRKEEKVMNRISAGLLLVALCVSFAANAARPSFTSLQQQINQLQAQINQLESQVVTGNTPGDMQYWDGAAWVLLPAAPPIACATLSSRHGVLAWGPCTVFIGDTGPAGGVVFYVDGTGQHGLEAAPIDQGIAAWGCVGVSLPGADGLVIGTGAQNTADIINNCADTNTAARLADAYVLNGYDDWFLPSRDELFMLYANNPIVGGFANDNYKYWSSSEYNGGDAWNKSFLNGGQHLDNKDRPNRVRAVRAF